MTAVSWAVLVAVACAAGCGYVAAGPGVGAWRLRQLAGPSPALPPVAVHLLPRLRRRVQRQRADDLRTAAGRAFSTVAAELRAGRPVADALAAAAGDAPGSIGDRLSAAATRVGSGDDATEALCGPGDPVVAALLEPLAGVLGVASTGAGLATVVDRLALAARADQRVADTLRAELAGPRATAGLLAVLPVFGLLLAAASGARPAHVLLATPAGGACLLIGLALDLAGLSWARRIVREAEPR